MKNITIKDLKFFAVAWSIVLCVLSVIHYLKGHFVSYKIHLAVAVIVFVTGFVRPGLLKPVMIVFKAVWQGFVAVLTGVALTIFFYLVVTPIGMLIRILGKDPLSRSLEKNTTTYWVDRTVTRATRESLERQF